MGSKGALCFVGSGGLFSIETPSIYQRINAQTAGTGSHWPRWAVRQVSHDALGTYCRNNQQRTPRDAGRINRSAQLLRIVPNDQGFSHHRRG